jgi:phosphohistidine phosphatase
MRLYLVQHGQAKSKDEDPGRPLTEKGRNDVKKIADTLGQLQLSVNTIWHSGKTRAQETADILAGRIIAGNEPLQHQGLSPNDAIEPVKEEIEECSVDLMIVGHLPFMSKLASDLLAADQTANLVTFQPGGIVCLDRDNDKTWSLCWMITPEVLT